MFVLYLLVVFLIKHECLVLTSEEFIMIIHRMDGWMDRCAFVNISPRSL